MPAMAIESSTPNHPDCASFLPTFQVEDGLQTHEYKDRSSAVVTGSNRKLKPYLGLQVSPVPDRHRLLILLVFSAAALLFTSILFCCCDGLYMTSSSRGPRSLPGDLQRHALPSRGRWAVVPRRPKISQRRQGLQSCAEARPKILSSIALVTGLYGSLDACKERNAKRICNSQPTMLLD